jgi:hypothetical protein
MQVTVEAITVGAVDEEREDATTMETTIMAAVHPGIIPPTPSSIITIGFIAPPVVLIPPTKAPIVPDSAPITLQPSPL